MHIGQTTARIAIGSLLVVSVSTTRAAELETTPTQSPLRIAVSNHVRPEFEQIAQAFERETSIPVAVVYAPNDEIIRAAPRESPTDLLVASESEGLRRLAGAGIVTTQSLTQYASEPFVLWQPENTTPALRLATISDLNKPPFTAFRIAIADPDKSRHGAVARDALAAIGISSGPRIVLAQRVRDCPDLVKEGAAECALIPASRAPKDAGRSAPAAVENPTLTLPLSLAIVADSQNAAAAEQFRKFCLDSRAAEILKLSGFEVPREPARH